MAELDVRTAALQSKTMAQYVEGFSREMIDSFSEKNAREFLGQALDNLLETAAMLGNVSDRLASHTGEAEPAAAMPPLLMQDENSGRDGRRYNEWHASRPDARLNAREAAQTAATPAAPGEVTDERQSFLKWYDSTTKKHARHERWEAWQARAALSHSAPVAAPASVPQAIDQLVSTLAESKGWMRDYARALIEDAIDRRHLEVAAPAPASEAVAWEAASERYLADIIDRAPEPLRRLGEWLSLKLDEDDWKTAERYVLGAMESIATPSTGGGK